MFGLDYTSMPSITAMRGTNPPVSFACRYVGYFSGYNLNDIAAPQGKCLTPGEAKTLSQAGIAIISNYEWYNTRPIDDGLGHAWASEEAFNAGAWDAQTAQKIHAACGGPADRPIYFSVDFNTTATPAIIDYFKGVASVIGLARTGAYGGYACIKGLLDAGAIRWAWQTYAWSAEQWDPRAHIRQYQNSVTLDGLSVDYDESMQADFGQWTQGGAMQLYTPQSADFAQWYTALDATHWKSKDGHVVQFAIKDFYAHLSLDGNSLPVIGLPRSNEQYLTVSGKQIVLQVFERGAIWYDTNHLKGTQPGTDGICQLAFLTDPDLLVHIPGLPLLPAPVDTTALVAAINAIPDAIAPAVANALVEAKKL